MTQTVLFQDRPSAGKELAASISLQLKQLEQEGMQVSPLVYALPRGGIPVAIPVAEQLGCPLDIIVAKKITTPANRELAIGAVTNEGHTIWTEPRLLRKISLRGLREAMQQAQAKAKQQQIEFAPYRPPVSPQGKIAIVVDDGIATGMTISVAAQAASEKQVEQVWLCAPVAPLELISYLQSWSDRVVVLATPHPFMSVGRFYRQFEQIRTEVALAMLKQHNQQFGYCPVN